MNSRDQKMDFLKEKQTKLPFLKIFFGLANLQDQKINSLKIIIIK